MFFFCKQKTAYEMRISDWSSDVCSSDLELRESGLMDMLPGKGEVMIQMIVSLYRAIIGVLFVVGLVATFALAAQGGAGLIMGLGIVLFMVMALGISAVLLSINDHLAAARPTSVSEASYSTEMRPTNWKAIGGFGALALVAIAISAYLAWTSTRLNSSH